MSDIAIRAENLSKRYRIGLREQAPATLRGAARSLLSAPFGYLKRMSRPPTEEETLWALRDVSFEVKHGEVLGIIGRNGAGKSTLLKILSRITEPSGGRAEVYGRVGSLLEVGTGFHPELTGRENIYLNGAILGMKRAEIDRNFDEIVDFAGVERFLDTPVKRYSSGMYVRLAFAVAAHLEPEILLVDEILAVGDTAFQKKCVGKMGEVADQGRTVLVVSHNMGTIESLCSIVLLLEKGTCSAHGSPSSIIRQYLEPSSGPQGSQADLANHVNRLGGMKPLLCSVQLLDSQGRRTTTFGCGDPIVIRVEYDASQYFGFLAGVGFNVTSISGVRVGGYNTYMGTPAPHRIPGSGSVEFTICGPPLTPGEYSLTVSLGDQQNHLVDKVEGAINLSVTPKDFYGTGYLLAPGDGVVGLECEVAFAS